MGFWEHLWYTASTGSTCKCVYISLECSQMLMHFLPVCDWGTMRLTLLGAPTHKTWPDHSTGTPWTLCPTLTKIYDARLASKFCCGQSVDHEGLGESHTGIRQCKTWFSNLDSSQMNDWYLRLNFTYTRLLEMWHSFCILCNTYQIFIVKTKTTQSQNMFMFLHSILLHTKVF